MGNKITILLALIVGTGILVLVLTITGNKVGDRTTIGVYDLEILEAKGKCELVFRGEKESGRLPLGPKPPCRFLTEEGGRVQYYPFLDANIIAVLIVIGTPSKPDPKIPMTLDKNYYCGDESQGVIVRKDGVFITKLLTLENGSILCTNFGADAKTFEFFSGEELLGPKKE